MLDPEGRDVDGQAQCFNRVCATGDRVGERPVERIARTEAVPGRDRRDLDCTRRLPGPPPDWPWAIGEGDERDTRIQQVLRRRSHTCASRDGEVRRAHSSVDEREQIRDRRLPTTSIENHRNARGCGHRDNGVRQAGQVTIDQYDPSVLHAFR